MINIDSKNTLNDRMRLLRYIIPLVATFALGFLVDHYFYGVSKAVSCNCNYSVTCASPTVEVRNYTVKSPLSIPKTGVDSACNR